MQCKSLNFTQSPHPHVATIGAGRRHHLRHLRSSVTLRHETPQDLSQQQQQDLLQVQRGDDDASAADLGARLVLERLYSGGMCSSNSSNSCSCEDVQGYVLCLPQVLEQQRQTSTSTEEESRNQQATPSERGYRQSGGGGGAGGGPNQGACVCSRRNLWTSTHPGTFALVPTLGITQAPLRCCLTHSTTPTLI
jgi:hypothetical protein